MVQKVMVYNLLSIKVLCHQIGVKL